MPRDIVGNMNRSTVTRIVFGVIVIIFGLLALLGAIGAFNFGEAVSHWWPSLIVIGGILLFVNNPRQFVWPSIAVILGVLFQLRQFELLSFNIGQLFWPVIVIGIGLSIILNRSNRGSLKATDENVSSTSVLFSGSDIKNHSDNYRGGNLSATLGGIKLDLREAKIKKTATLNVFALMGGIELIVPKGWKVQTNVAPILGGVDGSKLETPKAGAPTLIITGDVVLGGVDLKH